MKILVSGVCGFVGSTIANGLLDNVSSREIIGIDNLSRAGSQLNVAPLRHRGVTMRHADLAPRLSLAILLTVLAINLVGDRLRDALDPRVG